MKFGLVSGARRLSVEEDAAQWLVRRDRGGLSSGEAAAFDAWMENPANAEAYARADDLMGLFDQDDVADAGLRALRQEARRTIARPPRRTPAWGIAAAAVVLLALLSGALWTTWRPDARTAGTEVAARSTGPHPAAPVRVASAPAVVAPEIKTAVGERRTIRLADGTRVTLDTHTRIVVAFDEHRRLVRLLRGQALFEVAHNPRWPFTVEAADRQVTALGTVFEVSNYPGRLHVLLVEGRVVVERAKDAEATTSADTIAPVILKPGQSLVAELGAPQQVATVDVARQLMWRDGFVEFDNETLAQAVGQINRYIPQPIRIADDRVGDLRVSGVFRTGDAQQFVDAIRTVLPVEARPEPDGALKLTATESK